jgi:prepilin-type N-terminal cleavage/methylation domain-containing protein
MWKFNNRKGFALIEVLCSLVLISLLINSVLFVLTNSIKVHEENMSRRKYISFIDALSKEIEWNWNYEDITDIKNKQSFYIDKSHMDLEVLRSNIPEKIFTCILPLEQPYIKVSISDGNILTVNINLYYKAFGEQKNININCYKGRFR